MIVGLHPLKWCEYLQNTNADLVSDLYCISELTSHRAHEIPPSESQAYIGLCAFSDSEGQVGPSPLCHVTCFEGGILEGATPSSKHCPCTDHVKPDGSGLTERNKKEKKKKIRPIFAVAHEVDHWVR